MALAVEEGMIRNIANRVTSDGIGAFDVELGDFQAVGTWSRIAYESIIGTARAAIAAMTNHRGIRTRPSTLSTGQGRSANQFHRGLVSG